MQYFVFSYVDLKRYTVQRS